MSATITWGYEIIFVWFIFNRMKTLKKTLRKASAVNIFSHFFTSKNDNEEKNVKINDGICYVTMATVTNRY